MSAKLPRVVHSSLHAAVLVAHPGFESSTERNKHIFRVPSLFFVPHFTPSLNGQLRHGQAALDKGWK